MSWLRKIGKVVYEVSGLSEVFGPLLSGVVSNPQAQAGINAVTDDLTKIAAAVSTVEIIANTVTDGSMKGPAKVAAVTPLVAQAILSADFTHGKGMPKHPDLFKKGCAAIGSGMADVMNSYED